METIWAPWRMEYILGPKGGGCIFCEMAGRAPHQEDLVLTVRERALVCLNKFPFTAGALLVAPRKHVADPMDLSPGEHADLFSLVRDAADALRRAVGCQGMNIGVNIGEAGGAGIADHLHVHVVPRWSGDSNFMPVIAGTRVMPEYLAETWRRLRPHFESLDGG